MNDGTTKMPGGILTPKTAKALKIPVPPGFKDKAFMKNQRKLVTALRKQMKTGVRQYINDGGQKYDVNAMSAKIVKEKKKTNQGFIFRKSVKIPARPMDTITKQDEDEFAETIENYMWEILTSE
jgi:hypothetical protein